MRAVRRFVKRNLQLLSTVPSAFFSVSLLQISHRPESQEKAARYVPSFLEETGWRPQLTAVFAGAMKYTRFGWLGKRLMRAIWQKEGLEADITRDYEYTCWEEVDRFVEEFQAMLAPDGKTIPFLASMSAR